LPPETSLTTVPLLSFVIQDVVDRSIVRPPTSGITPLNAVIGFVESAPLVTPLSSLGYPLSVTSFGYPLSGFVVGYPLSYSPLSPGLLSV